MPPQDPKMISEAEKSQYLQIYLHEFDALSNRLTYWLTLQYAPYAIAAVAVGYFVKDFPDISANFAWACLLILQLLMWAVLQSTHEVFTYVVYFKECLKPRIRQLFQDSGPSFLDFESFLNRLRQRWFLSFETRFGLIVIVVVGMCALCWIAIRNTPSPNVCHWPTIGWICINSYALFLLVGKATDIRKLQTRSAAPDFEEPICQ